MADKATELKKKLRESKEELSTNWDIGVSSGLTLLNLACSGRQDVAFLPGHYYSLVGDTSSGKTWLIYQVMAEAVRKEWYNGHRLLMDAPERGANMEVRRFFGGLADRLEVFDPPSHTLEECYDRIDTLCKKGMGYILGVDSEDSLIPEAELLKIKEDAADRKKAADKGKEYKPDGSYGTARAKTNSSRLRVAHNGLEETGSLLFIIKQTRDRIGFGSQFNPKTKSGGNAITFYATLELWFSVRGDIKRKAKGKNRVVGKRMKVHVEKNRLSGRDRTIELLFYPEVGFDETGSLIHFMMEEGGWKATKDQSTKEYMVVDAPEFNFSGHPEDLAIMIEDKGLEKELRASVGDLWCEIEDACKVQRKPRYS